MELTMTVLFIRKADKVLSNPYALTDARSFCSWTRPWRTSLRSRIRRTRRWPTISRSWATTGTSCARNWPSRRTSGRKRSRRSTNTTSPSITDCWTSGATLFPSNDCSPRWNPPQSGTCRSCRATSVHYPARWRRRATVRTSLWNCKRLRCSLT